MMKESVRKEILSTCTQLMAESIDFIEGCRKLVSLRNQHGLEEDLNFSSFVGVVSEIDDYPDESVRGNFSKDYLEQIDREIMNYVLDVRPSIIEGCSILIEKYR